MNRNRSRWLPTPSLVVAMIALVLAMSGSAVALKGKNSVKSNDIAPRAVKSSDIAKGAVRTPQLKNAAVAPLKLDLVKVDGLAGPLPTASGPPVDLGGPSVTVKVPHTGLVAIYARVTGQINGGGANSRAQVHLHEPTLLPRSPRIIEFTSAQPELRVTTPGTGDFDGATNLVRGGFLVFPADRGTYTFSLRYSRAGGGTALFQNAGLWAGVIG